MSNWFYVREEPCNCNMIPLKKLHNSSSENKVKIHLLGVPTVRAQLLPAVTIIFPFYSMSAFL